MELNPLLTTTTITDRAGRRIGTYLVDRSKDSLDREKQERHKSHQAEDDEAVVMHHSSSVDTTKSEIDVEADPLTGAAVLNIRV